MKFQANTFKQIAEMSKQHGIQMFKQEEQAHLQSMNHMEELMQNPIEMQKWFEDKRQEFEDMAED